MNESAGLTLVRRYGLRAGAVASLTWSAMSLQALRGRMPMIVFLLLALVCLAILGFACACLSDHPAQAIERALASIPAAPPLVEVWSLAFAALLGSSALVAGRRERIAAAPSQATLQRFLF